jgi:beta-glucanase (GH16 family)
VAWGAHGQNTNNTPVTFNFDGGQLPAGTVFVSNQAGTGVTNGGGFTNSGCMVLTRPGTGAQNYGQWVVTNDLANGTPVTSFDVSFKLYMGHGSGGDVNVPNHGGNGLVFHLGPVPPSQYTGSASSWGNGLDVTFRTYSSVPNTSGINVEYNTVTGAFNPGNGTMVATSSFLGFYQTNGPADSFAEAVDVWLGFVDGMLSVVCSNALIGNVIVYTNLAIPAFAPISPGQVAFTATEGGGAHEDAWIDEMSISLNSYQPTGAVSFVQQPANQTTRPGDPVTFTVNVAGASPTYQWRSNGVPLAGATAASYSTPPATPAMDGALYSVAVTNDAGGAISSSATLRVLPALSRTLVWNDEFNGTAIDSTKWQQLGDYSRQQGYWLKQDSYLNGQGQLVLRVMQDPATGHYGSGAVQGNYQRTFGYFEAKVKFPTQQGHWCAFWLFTMSQGSTNIIGGADGCEIDIMEKAWLTDHIQHALHWDGYSPSPLAGSAGLQVLNMGMNDGGWHVFGLDWTPTNYVFYVDGTQTYSTNAGGVSQVPEYVMLTEEVGNFGSGPDAWGTGPITNATLPDYYLVEYVRIYDTNEPQAQLSYPVLLNASNLVLSWSGGGNLLSATNLAGPWVVVTNAASPFTSLVAPNTPRQFFRVQQ